MCAEIRKTGSRFRELYGAETVSLTALLVTMLTFLLGLTVGCIVTYFFCVYVTLRVWNDENPPFDWIDSDAIKLVLVLFAPLTVAGIIIGIWVMIFGAPYFFWRDTQKMLEKRRKQIENGNTYVKLDEPRLRNWLIGIPIYYLCLAGFLVGMYAVVKSG